MLLYRLGNDFYVIFYLYKIYNCMSLFELRIIIFSSGFKTSFIIVNKDVILHYKLLTDMK